MPVIAPECWIGLVGGDDAARGRGQIAQVVPGRLAVGADLFVRVGWQIDAGPYVVDAAPAAEPVRVGLAGRGRGGAG
jgi:hypothetical protein